MPQADVGPRIPTRVLAIYNLGVRLDIPEASTYPLTRHFDMGRFEGHVKANASLLPQVAGLECIPPSQFLLPSRRLGAGVDRITAVIATTPRQDGLLFLDIDLAGQPTAAEVAEFLYATWRWRSELRVGDTPLLGWLAGRLDQVRTVADKPLVFGQNQHQCVFAGDRLARRLLGRDRLLGRGRRARMTSPDALTVVLRGTMTAKRGSDLGIRRPVALNNPGESMVAHGRGVSLIAGWTEPVENAFGIAAAGLVNAAGVVSRVRLESLDALRDNETSRAKSPPDLRELIEGLSDRLDRLRLDLSFGIEAYADVVLVPELLVESYHSSLRRMAGLPESVANTSRIVDRVAAIIDSRHASLAAAIQEHEERRDKIFAGAIAIGTLLALPPALLLAYFGTNSTNVNQNLSIFDLRHYGLAYLAAWLPFLALVGGAAIMRRRVRLDAPRWRRPEGRGPDKNA